MRQKLITLCPNSFEIAQKKANFSQWVRNKLLEDDEASPKSMSNYEYQCPLCKKTTEWPHQLLEWECWKCNIKLDFVKEVIQ